MRILAVDFGTSNTVAALAQDGGAPRLISIDGSPLVPSSVFLADDGSLTVGRDADRQARIDPSRYEPNPKRRIDEAEVLLGQAVVPVSRLVAAVLGLVGTEVRRQLGGPPDEVRLTHPARWGERRRQVLIAAARDAGLTLPGRDPVLIPEPVAAATHFATLSGSGLAPGGQLAVYDLGGGTFDVALVRREASAGDVVRREASAGDVVRREASAGYDVSAEAGLPDLGGVDFDQAIIEHIGRTHARAVDPAAWERLLHPADAHSRRQQRALLVDVRDGKEALSRYAHTDIALPPPFTDVHVTRSEFENLIRPNLGRSVHLLRQTIANARVEPGQLAGIYLVGGSSRIPLVARLIQEELGVTPTTLDQPETSVATGALYLPIGGPAAAAVRPQISGSTTTNPPTNPASHAPASDPRGPSRPPFPAPEYRPVNQPAPHPYQQPAPAGRSKSRTRLVAAVVAVLLLAAGATAATLALRSDGKNSGDSGKKTGAQGTSSTSSGPAPPVTIVPGAGTCTSNFQNCLDDTALRSYVQPTYGDMKSCKKNDAFGVSNLVSQTGVALATCQYKNGYQILFLKVDKSNLSFYRQFISGNLAAQSSLSKQSQENWDDGTLITFNEAPKGAGLYWDKSTSGILGMVESTSASVEDLHDWWKRNFAR